jgi:hypothetical protein
VLPCPQLIFPSKTWFFFGIYLNFQLQKSLKKSISPTFWIQILLNKFHKSCSSRSSQQHQRHIPIPPKFAATILIHFWVKKSFNIQELFHCKSKHHGTKPMHSSSLRAFQRHQEHDPITTKQNKTNYLPPHRDLSKDTKNMIS